MKNWKRIRFNMAIWFVVSMLLGAIMTIMDMERRGELSEPDWGLAWPFWVASGITFLLGARAERKLNAAKNKGANNGLS